MKITKTKRKNKDNESLYELTIGKELTEVFEYSVSELEERLDRVKLILEQLDTAIIRLQEKKVKVKTEIEQLTEAKAQIK